MLRQLLGTALALGALAGFDPGVARAQAAAGAAPARHLPASDYSPQSFAFELRFGPYLPQADRSADQPIFSEFFGNDDRVMFGVELDYQIWRIPHVGPIGVGVGWGYTTMSGPNQVPEGTVVPEGEPTQDSTLSIMPTYAVSVLRIDSLMRGLNVPLVPYGKLGVAHAFWWVDDGTGTAENEDLGVTGKDTSTGLQMAVGGMFLLDVLEPSTARGLDSDVGVNNSYLFFEWSVSNYTGDQMNVGDSTWVTGLAFEM